MFGKSDVIMTEKEQKDFLEQFDYALPCRFRISDFYSIVEMQAKGKHFSVFDGKSFMATDEELDDIKHLKFYAKSILHKAVLRFVDAAVRYKADIKAIDFYIASPIDVMAGVFNDGHAALRAMICIAFNSKK